MIISNRKHFSANIDRNKSTRNDREKFLCQQLDEREGGNFIYEFRLASSDFRFDLLCQHL